MSAPRYREEILLGTGGMAEVWRARGPAGIVALKRLLPHAARNPSVSAAFEREGKLLSRIRHPNVVGIREIGRDERGAFLALEYVQGADLRTLANGPVPQRVALRIARDLLLALEAVHSLCDEQGNALGLIHRDLSPANVLVGFDGRVKLTDFGISRALWGSNATTGQSIKGTLAYLSPEQAIHAPVDARSDLFSLGALLFQMLAGATIYDEVDPRLALAQARAGEVESIGAKAPDLPPAIVELVDRSLAASPGDRFANAATMVADLERAAGATCGLADDNEVGHWSAAGASDRDSGGVTDAEREFTDGPASREERRFAITRSVDSTARAVDGAPTAPTFGRVRVAVAASMLMLAIVGIGLRFVAAKSSKPSSAAGAAPAGTSMSESVQSVPVATRDQLSARHSDSEAPPASEGAVVAENRSNTEARGGARRIDPRAAGASREPGLLDLGSDPAFAYVTIDGTKAGATPLYGRPLPPGSHRIEVSRDGLGSKAFTIQMSPGERVTRVVKWP
jgi:serine/threonine protein kinase